MTRTTAGVVLAAVAVVAVGLVVMSWNGNEPRTIATAGGAILVAGETDEGMDAAFESRLAFTADGCLGLAGPSQDEAGIVAVFPSGTKVVDDSPLAIRVNGERVELGQLFTGGGGEVSNPTSNDLVPTGPAACLEQPVFLMAPS